MIASPLPGRRQPNPYCAAYKPKDPDPIGERAVGRHASSRSVGSRRVHLGDLTWNKEFDLMCPTNRLGTVDLFIVSHHGQAISNSEVLVHALAPRVAIMNNGTRKGGQPDAMKVMYSSPGLEDLWQIHFSLLSGQEYTVPGMFIANGVGRAAGGDADRGHRRARAGAGCSAAARAQRRGVLDQGLRARGRIVHRDERAQRLLEDVRRAQVDRRTGARAGPVLRTRRLFYGVYLNSRMLPGFASF